MQTKKLFCFPYAGGTAKTYKKWADMLSKQINLLPIELPGRGQRLREDPLKSINLLVEDAYEQIKDRSIDKQYAFFGHSLGAIIACELTYKLRDNGLSKPEYIFVSGMGPLHCQPRKESIHSLPEAEFKEQIAAYGGTPEEVFTDSQLKELFIPILRADFKAYDEYSYKKRNNPAFESKIVVFAGRDDELAVELEEWQRYSKQKIDIYQFAGGHFFFQQETNRDKIIRIINEKL